MNLTDGIEVGGGAVPIADLERIKTIPFLGIETRGYRYTGNRSQLVFNLDSKPLADLRVRQAIAHAIDLKAVLATAWYGYGRISPTAISPALPEFHDASLKPYAYDLAQAARLLDEAGYKRAEDGKRFSLRLTYNPYNDGNRSFGSTTQISRANGTIGSRRSVSSGLCSSMLNGPRTRPNTPITWPNTCSYSDSISVLLVTGV
jgi:ABC-type transport system substrate-binding protein